MFDTGRVCVKIAGRDAGKTCVIIKKIDNVFVMIDGETRRRKCNLKHLEPLDKTLNVNEDASHKEVITLFKEKLKIEIKETKPKKAKPRQRKQHIKKEKPIKETKKKSQQKTDSAKKTEVKAAKVETKAKTTKKTEIKADKKETKEKGIEAAITKEIKESAKDKETKPKKETTNKAEKK